MLRPRCPNRIAAINIAIMQQQNLVTLSRQCCCVPSSASVEIKFLLNFLTIQYLDDQTQISNMSVHGQTSLGWHRKTFLKIIQPRKVCNLFCIRWPQMFHVYFTVVANMQKLATPIFSALSQQWISFVVFYQWYVSTKCIVQLGTNDWRHWSQPLQNPKALNLNQRYPGQHVSAVMLDVLQYSVQYIRVGRVFVSTRYTYSSGT